MTVSIGIINRNGLTYTLHHATKNIGTIPNFPFNVPEKDVTANLSYESLNFYLRLILWTMLLWQNLDHKIALEYCGEFFQYKFVTLGKNFEYKISKMLLDVCFDLSLWWHLPN